MSQYEPLVWTLKVPLASTYIRSPLRQRVSSEDASEFGGTVQANPSLVRSAEEEAQLEGSLPPLGSPVGERREVATLTSEASSSLAPMRATETMIPRKDLSESMPARVRG